MKLKHVAAALALLGSAAVSTSALAVVNLTLKEAPKVTAFTFDDDELANLTFTVDELSTGSIFGFNYGGGTFESYSLSGPGGTLVPGFSTATWPTGVFTLAFSDLVAGTYTFSLTGTGAASISSSITPVPEPESYAMMLAGLGAVGFLLRRRAGR